MSGVTSSWDRVLLAGRASFTASRTLAVVLTVVLTAALLASCGDTESSDAKSTVLRFAALPHTDTTELTAKFRPMADYFAEQLGVEVEYVPMTDYSGLVAAFVGGDVQLAWFGGLTGAQARSKVEGARAIAQGTTDPYFKSYFVAHADLGLTLKDEFPMELEGKTFTFGSDSSTSGRLMPEYFLRQETGKSPAEFFGREPAFSGQHDLTALAVQDHTYDAGVLNYTVYDSMVAEGKIDPEVCVKIWETPPYADYNWTAHPVLDERFGEGFVDRVQQAIVDMDDPGLLAAMKRPDGMIPAKNEDFEAIRETAVALDMLR